MRKENISLLLVSALLVAPAHSFMQSSTALRPTQFVAQRQQPVTVADDDVVKPTKIDPAHGGGLACPVGYALTAVGATAEAKKTVTVYRECNGVGAYYVHTWCGNNPVSTSTVSKVPTVTYTCQRLENKWVALDDDGGVKGSVKHSHQV